METGNIMDEILADYVGEMAESGTDFEDPNDY